MFMIYKSLNVARLICFSIPKVISWRIGHYNRIITCSTGSYKLYLRIYILVWRILFKSVGSGGGGLVGMGGSISAGVGGLHINTGQWIRLRVPGEILRHNFLYFSMCRRGLSNILVSNILIQIIVYIISFYPSSLHVLLRFIRGKFFRNLEIFIIWGGGKQIQTNSQPDFWKVYKNKESRKKTVFF